MSKTKTIYSLRKRIEIGKEVSRIAQNTRYYYEAYRLVGKEFVRSEAYIKECHQIFLAYELGLEDNK